ncbi:alpha-galactosidase [Zafaria sp. Z1313]|uniref:alpha-galactosidase n=1 Tax=unclassified Zafaria TaxID=2828765 RepID=UPI002E762974|nr:alpha-galactosidase [Zafaria sp. J156]MEE1621534.1 alpha-galactosidase [Zafaria sp. J156]
MALIRLAGEGTALVLDPGTESGPAVVHFGADPGPLPGTVPAGSVLHSSYDTPHVFPLWPQAAHGWSGTPLLTGSREGRDASAVFTHPRVEEEDGGLTLTAEDAEAGLRLATRIELLPGGLLRLRHTLANTGAAPYRIDALNAVVPAGPAAVELLDTTGRWTRERHPQRLPFRQGTWRRDGRHGRTGHDSPLLLAAGTTGFGNRSGEVWAVHFGWSGNYGVFAERHSTPQRLLGAGELPGSGELVLEPGGAHTSPWLYAAHSTAGLDGITERFHRYLRSRPNHPRTPRPVVLNTWEAVYFDHDLGVLKELADTAAELGVERFVLDDGWFGSRRDDTSGLGDWEVSPEAWPDGLEPLIAHVRGLGMEFGLWVEPEMANPDSELARNHPEWLCRARADRLAPTWRQQHVVDLANPAAFAHVRDSLDAVLSRARDAGHPVSFLKWDQNRDLADVSSAGAPSQHAQTLAAYALMDALKERHPGLEIESCSSGGGRVDLGVLEHTDRVWASDSNDALNRQGIQHWTQRVLPPELVGQHIGPATAHTSGRTHALGFRGITALFGHFGMEWDIREAQGADRETLRGLIALYRRHRGLLHSGTSVRADLGNEAFELYGTVAEDGGEALFALACLAASDDESPGTVAVPGLDPASAYRVSAIVPGGEAGTFGHRRPPAWLAEPLELPGGYLGTVGLPMPALNPERALLLHVERVR